MSALDKKTIDIYINGKYAGLTPQEIGREYKKTSAELNKLVKGSQEYEDKMREVQSLNKLLKEHRAQINDVVSSWDKVKTTLLAVAGGNLLSGFIQKGIGEIKGLISGVYEMDDAFADVQKTTGLTASQVEGLNAQLSKVDTRTKQKDLLDIAIIGGQIGVAKDEMESFVIATDKAAVALGDEFTGGAKEVTDKIGGLKILFKDTRDLDFGKAIEKIGSAINDLGAQGKATGPFMTDFAARMAGLGPQLTPTLSKVVGLGAALQELGETAENAASGSKTLITTGAANIGEFSKQLGMTEKDLKQLINTDSNEFLLKLAASFKGMAPTDVVKRLNALNISSKEAQGVMLKLAGNVDFVRQKQTAANSAFEKGTSLQQEFNVKNNTSAAQWEKVGKAVSNFFSNALTNVARTLADVAGWFYKNGEAIGTVVVWLGKAVSIWAAYKAVQMLNIKGTYEWIAAQAKALISGQSLTGMLTKLKSLDPFSLIAAGAFAVYQYWDTIVGQATQYEKTLDSLKDIEKEHQANFRNTKADIDLAFKSLKNFNGSQEERGKMIDEINNKYGTTIKNLKDEKAFVKQLDGEYNNLIKSLEKRMKADIAQAQYKKVLMDIETARENILYAKENAPDIGKDVLIKGLENQVKKLEKLADQKLAAVGKLIQSNDGKAVSPITGGELGVGASVSDSAFEKTKAKTKKENDYKEEAYKKLVDSMSEMEKEYMNLKLSDEAKELQAIQDKYDEQIKLADDNIKKLMLLAANNDKQALSKITDFELLKDELLGKQKTETDAKLAEMDKKANEEYEKNKLKTQKEIADALLSEYDRELNATNDKYKKLIKSAHLYGLNTVELEAARIKAIEDLQKAQDKKDEKKAKKDLKDLIKSMKAYYELFKDLMSSINQFRASKEDQQLAKYEKTRDAELDSLEKQKEAGKITEENYQASKAAIEDRYRKQAAAIKLEQWQREKRAKIADSIMNTAVAVTANLENPFLAAAVGVLGAIQTGLIIATPPPQFRKGARFKGPSHEQGGIPVNLAEFEGGETLLSKATSRNNAPLVDALLDSSMNRNGAPINMDSIYGPRIRQNFSQAREQLAATKMISNHYSNNYYQGGGSKGARGGMDELGKLNRNLEALLNKKTNVGQIKFVQRDYEKFVGDKAKAMKLASLQGKK